MRNLIAFLCIGLAAMGIAAGTAHGQGLILDPHGLAFLADNGDTLEEAVSLINETEHNLLFRIRLVDSSEARDLGPRRDDPGDLLASYRVPGGYWYDIAWDGRRMWGADYSSRLLIALDPETQEVERVGNLPFNGPIGMAWDGEAFWIGSYQTQLIYHVDTGGNVLASLDPPGAGVVGVAWDGEALWYVEYTGNSTIRRINTRGEVLRTLNLGALQRNLVTIAWAERHRDANLWMLYYADGTLWQLNIEDDDVEAVQTIRTNPSGYLGLEHDGENMWYTARPVAEEWYKIDDGVREPRWLTVTPERGELVSDGDVVLVLTVSPTEMAPGSYEIRMQFDFEIAGDPPQRWEGGSLEASVVLTVERRVANIIGRVTDLATGGVVRNARVALAPFVIRRVTAGDGRYEIDNLPLGEYGVTVSARDYLEDTAVVFLDDEGDYDVDFQLRFATCEPDRDSLGLVLTPDEVRYEVLPITNHGNGDLTYRTAWEHPGRVDPWDTLHTVPVGMWIQENRPGGAAFVDDLFYVCGGERYPHPNLIYVFDRQGNLQRTFEQLGTYRYGFQDLAWDGEFLWGSSERRIYGFTPDGDSVTSFNGPLPSNKSLTWDPLHDLLWVADVTSPIYGLRTDGSLARSLGRLPFYIYGLGFYPLDPDGKPLYILHSPGENRLLVHKVNLDDGDTAFVTEIPNPTGGRPVGAFITNAYDISQWVFMFVNNPAGMLDDRLEIRSIRRNDHWAVVLNDSGEVPAGQTVRLNLRFDTGYMPEGYLQSTLRIQHTGRGSVLRIPVRLWVDREPQPPSAFVLSTPADGDTLESYQAVFTWERSRYRFRDDSTLTYTLRMTHSRRTWSFATADTFLAVSLDTLEMPFWEAVTWEVEAASAYDTTACERPFTFRLSDLAAAGREAAPPMRFNLAGVRPNPFNGRAGVEFTLDRAGWVRLDAYDLSGRRAATLAEGRLSSGAHRVAWDASHLPAGVYLIRLRTEHRSATARAVVLK